MSELANVPVCVHTTSDVVGGCDLKGRLGELLSTIQTLQAEAEYLSIEADGIFEELEALEALPAEIDDVIEKARDGAYWIKQALSNVESEAVSVAAYLDDAIEAVEV